MSLRKPQTGRRRAAATLLWAGVVLELAAATWLATTGLPQSAPTTGVVTANSRATGGTRPSAAANAPAVVGTASAAGDAHAMASLGAAFHLLPPPRPVGRPERSATQPTAKAKTQALPDAPPPLVEETKHSTSPTLLEGQLAIRRAEDASPGDRCVLVGVVGSDGAPSTAIILNRDTEETLILSVGDAIDGRAIRSIDQNVVVLAPPVSPVASQ